MQAPEEPQNLVGKVINHYTLLDAVGQGSFSIVYKATHPKYDHPVVVKALLARHQQDAEVIQRFESEAHLISRLNQHPNIIPIYDYWQGAEGAFIVLKWMNGGTLLDLIEKHGALTLNQTVYMLDRVCSALAAAHEIGVIHRDLKPANIMFDLEGNVYLSDFGIAKRPDMNLTEPGAMLGTPAYLAPEQILGDPVTPFTDIYSMGILLFEVLTGRLPFQGKMAGQVMMQHLNKPVPFLEYSDAQLSQDINAVIQKATAKKPEDRYDNPLTMAAAFRSALGPPPPATAEEAQDQGQNPAL